MATRYLLTYWVERRLAITRHFSACRTKKHLATTKCFSTWNTERRMVATRHFLTCRTKIHSFMSKVDYELYKFFKYTPPFMKTIADEYFNMFDLYPKANIRIWSLALKGTSWVARLLNQLDTFNKFHFFKNGNQDSMKKMPVYDMKVWAHDLDMIVLMLEDPRKKQLAGLVYSINRINDELAPTSIKKGFYLLVPWRAKHCTTWSFIGMSSSNSLRLKRMNRKKTIKRAPTTLINFKASSGPHLTKKTKKGENKSWEEKEDFDKTSYWERR